MIEQIKIDVLDINHITNCYLLFDEDTKEAVIIDPADKANLIEERIAYLGLKPKYVLLTHAHIDHTIALSEIMNKYDIKTIAGKLEEGILVGKNDDCSNRYGLEQVNYNMEDFILAQDGQVFNVGNLSIEVIFTPGHTKGSVCYFVNKDNLLITGDTLFYNCFGRCDLDTSDIGDMIRSLKKLYRRFKNVNIYPGHGKINIPIDDTYDDVRVLMYNNYKIDIGGY